MAYADGKNPDIRVSDAERDAVVTGLGQHFQDGRLDQAEFDERVGRAMSAKTQADLSALFADLPETGAPAGETGAPAGAEGPGPRRRHPRPILGLVLVVVIILAAAHAVLFAGPWLWLGVLAAALLWGRAVAGRHDRT